MKKEIKRFKVRHFSKVYDGLFANYIKRQQPSSHISPLFIKGSGRNGSTLLSSILNNHGKIGIPPENRLIPDVIRYWHTHPFHSWEKKVNHICTILGRPSQWKIDILVIKTALLNMPENERNVAQILNFIYGSYRSGQHEITPVWGDKTPSNTRFIKLIKAQFPSSKIIFMVRDPRDVMTSYLKINKQYYNKLFDFMLWRWKNSIDKYNSLKEKFPEDIKLLKYENFVAKPAEEVNGIIEWLGLDSPIGLLNDYAKNLGILGAVNAEHHQNIYNPISTKSIGRWKSDLDNAYVQRIMNKLGSTMKRLDYD